jgi:hypothetical protein
MRHLHVKDDQIGGGMSDCGQRAAPIVEQLDRMPRQLEQRG